MRVRDLRLIVAGAAALAVSSVLFAQGGQAPRPESASQGSFDPRELSGVWSGARGGGPGERRGGPPPDGRAGGPPPAARGGAPGGAQPEFTAWGAAKFAESKPSNAGTRQYTLAETNDPVLKYCLPPGVPRIYQHPFPWQIVQTSKETIMLFEYDHIVRHVYTDGRQHPDDVSPSYMGHSIGRWDGATFVVDSVGFNDKTWLDRGGTPHSDQLHVIERFQRTAADRLEIETTVEDAKALAKPWVTRAAYQFRPTWDLLELACTDNVTFVDEK